jgi:hypothetical protein
MKAMLVSTLISKVNTIHYIKSKFTSYGFCNKELMTLCLSYLT